MVAVVLAFVAETAYAQGQVWREIHKVKKKETIFGIARQYGITIQELIEANPDMNKPDYELKKDSYINIPFAKTATPAAQPAAAAQPEKKVEERKDPNTIRLGVMLPLHDNNGDGRRAKGESAHSDLGNSLHLLCDPHAVLRFYTPYADGRDVRIYLRLDRFPLGTCCDAFHQ